MLALVVEQGFSRGTLTVVRALASAGWRVGVGTPGGSGLASSSRHCTPRQVVPATHEDPGAFLAAVASAGRRGRCEVVFGGGEAEVLALSEHRSAISAVVPHAGHDVVLSALDEARLAAAGAAAGFAVPVALELSGIGDDRPVVVKARLQAGALRRRPGSIQPGAGRGQAERPRPGAGRRPAPARQSLT